MKPRPREHLSKHILLFLLRAKKKMMASGRRSHSVRADHNSGHVRGICCGIAKRRLRHCFCYDLYFPLLSHTVLLCFVFLCVFFANSRCKWASVFICMMNNIKYATPQVRVWSKCKTSYVSRKRSYQAGTNKVNGFAPRNAIKTK